MKPNDLTVEEAERAYFEAAERADLDRSNPKKQDEFFAAERAYQDARNRAFWSRMREHAEDVFRSRLPTKGMADAAVLALCANQQEVADRELRLLNGNGQQFSNGSSEMGEWRHHKEHWVEEAADARRRIHSTE